MCVLVLSTLAWPAEASESLPAGKRRAGPCEGVGAESRPGRAELCRLSVTFSPYHLGYPIGFVSTEVRILRKLAIGTDAGVGSYRGGLVSQFGLRAPFYLLGTFEGGLQFGPFARWTGLYLPTRYATAPPTGLHSTIPPIYNDAEYARAIGRDALFFGALVGGKLILGRFGGRGGQWPRRITLQLGFLIGSHHPFGPSRFGPHPDASRTGSGYLSTMYFDTGMSF